jgi:hypothetical protein
MYTTTNTTTTQIAVMIRMVCQKSGDARIVQKTYGISAMMPAMITSEAPFPTPYSVMSSLSHITTMVPATSDTATTSASAIGWLRMLGSTISGYCAKIPV